MVTLSNLPRVAASYLLHGGAGQPALPACPVHKKHKPRETSSSTARLDQATQKHGERDHRRDPNMLIGASHMRLTEACGRRSPPTPPSRGSCHSGRETPPAEPPKTPTQSLAAYTSRLIAKFVWKSPIWLPLSATRSAAHAAIFCLLYASSAQEQAQAAQHCGRSR